MSLTSRDRHLCYAAPQLADHRARGDSPMPTARTVEPLAGTAITMSKFLGVWVILIAATAMEASGDAMVRIGLFAKTGAPRFGALAGGAALLFGYGVAVNLTKLPFERVVGLYIATLFVVWQLVSFVTFRSIPRYPIVVGGMLIVLGGLLVTFWTVEPKQPSTSRAGEIEVR